MFVCLSVWTGLNIRFGPFFKTNREPLCPQIFFGGDVGEKKIAEERSFREDRGLIREWGEERWTEAVRGGGCYRYLAWCQMEAAPICIYSDDGCSLSFSLRNKSDKRQQSYNLFLFLLIPNHVSILKIKWIYLGLIKKIFFKKCVIWMRHKERDCIFERETRMLLLQCLS